MKKLLSLFVPLLALFLTLAPQTARAATYYYNCPLVGSGYENCLRIKNTYTSASNNFIIRVQLIGNWNDTEMQNLNLYYLKGINGKLYTGTNKSSKTPVATQLKSASSASSGFVAKTSGSSYYWSFGSLQYTGYKTPNASNYITSTSTPNENEIYFYMNPTNIEFSPTKYVQVCIYSQASYFRCEISGDMQSMVYGSEFASEPNKHIIKNNYQFYKFFTSYDVSQEKWGNAQYGRNETTIDCTNLILSATTLKPSCYESMFEDFKYDQTSGNNMYGPVIKVLSLKDCNGDITDCCKNMFNGRTYLQSITAYFMDWGNGTGSASPTYNWITSSQALTFNCPSSLTETKDASHMGTNGTKNASVTPDVYVFNVADNGFTWDGTCNLDKYYFTSAPTVSAPHESGFDGWYSEEGEKVTPSSDLSSSPSGTKIYYAERTGSVTVPYTITFKSDDGSTLETKSCRPGHVPAFTGNANKPGYIFTGWDKEIVAATADATYTATYVQEPDYFTITNRHASQKLTAALRYGSYVPTHVTLKYRIISKEGVVGDWQDYNSSTAGNGTSRTIADIPAGASMQLYGSNIDYGFGQSSMKRWAFTLAGSGEAVLSGELMSIFSGTETTIDNTETLPSYAFYNFFYDTNAKNTRIFSAKDLKLSATNLGNSCYSQMFYECSNMVDAPLILPATTLTTECYMSMFSNCKALTTTPVLPATTLTSSCYASMFSGCTALTTAPALPATTLATACYSSMFSGCTHLVNVQSILPAGTLPQNCYNEMFKGCTALTTAPEIAATTISGSAACYGMFSDCTSLTQAPSNLYAPTLPSSSYYSMFANCSSLVKAPNIHATSYVASNGGNCMDYMFSGCTSLNYMRIYYGYNSANMVELPMGSNCWVKNVPNEGVIYCPPKLSQTYGSINNFEKLPKSVDNPWTVYSYDVTFIVKSGGLWADNTSANKHYIWSENDVDVVNKFLDDEAEVYTKFYTDNSYEHSKLISIADIKEALSRKQGETYTAKTYYAVKADATYSLEWDENGGSALTGTYTSGDVAPGSTITAPADPTMSGYAFLGWKDQFGDDFTGTMPAEDVTYTAQWKRVFTITATCNDGTVSLTAEGYTEKTGAGSYLEGTDLTMTVVPDDGYRFVRWTDNNTDNPRHITVSATASYTAELEVIPTHYATFYNEDGTQLQKTLVREGVMPVYDGTPTKTGYVFSGWDKDIEPMGTDDVSYTATFAEYFTITNTGTTNYEVKLYWSGTSTSKAPTIDLHVRIIQADGTIGVWTPKSQTAQKTSSSSVSLGTIPAGGKLQIYGSNATNGFHPTSSSTGRYYFNLYNSTAKKVIKISGNLLSLIACTNENTFVKNCNIPQYCFMSFFSGNTDLISADGLVFPNTISDFCYSNMFYGCSNMTTGPKTLPATSLPTGCYEGMFTNCSTLVKSPDILATTTVLRSCSTMFQGCVKMESIRYYATEWENTNNVLHTRNWVSGFQTNGTFYCPYNLPREYATGKIPYYYYSSSSEYKNWTVYSYDVTFVPVGGNWADGSSDNMPFTWRTDVSDVTDFMTEQTETVVDYYSDEGCQSKISDINTILTKQPSNNNTTYIYAKISASANDVTLKANGGTGSDQVVSAANGSPMPTTLKDGETAISAPTAPAGYKFGGYYDTNESSGGTQYYTAALASARNWDKSSDTNLFARWIQKSYKLNLTSGGNGTVTRNDNGDSETVKHYNETVTLTPSESAGYHFYSWSGNGAAYVSNNVFTVPDGEDNTTYNVQAVFAPNTNTAYTVKHYKQNIDCSTYPDSPFETDNLEGTTATNVTPAVKSYEGFTAPSTQTISILADGSRVVEYYYTRNTYTVTVNVNTTGYGTVRAGSGEEQNSLTVASVPYGTEITTSTNTVTINGTQVAATKHADDAQYTYTFTGWTNGTETVTGALTVTANFTRTTNQYTVTWMNESGTGDALETDANQNYGTATAFNGTIPTKEATAQYTYTFDGWATEANGAKVYNINETPTVSGNTTYYAHFSAATRQYTVTWMNESGTGDALETDANQNYGTATAFNGTAPTKASTAQYTYTFDGWATEANGAKVYSINETPTVSGNTTYYAHFSAATNKYTILWKNEDGTTLETDEDVEYGTMPEYNGATPTKEADTEHTYTFSGWTPALTSVTGEVTYTATYSTGTNSYTIRFLNWNNDVLQSGSVAYGTTPEYTGDAPTKASDLIYSYTFSGWDKAITAVDGDKDYKAVYTSADLADFDLVDDKNENDDYYDVLSALVGKTRNVTYKRTMSPGQWNVVSLPFDFSLVTNQGHPFNGNIYEMTGATYNDGYLDFNFMPMTTVMKANKPYIFYFYGNENKSDVRFENVKIKPLAEYDDSEDNVKVTVNVTGGTIKFRNTTYRENIYDSVEKERKRRVFINGTNLRYPNNPNIWIRAFRGYFYLGIGDEYITYIQPRLHIINGGQVTTLLEGAEQDNGTEVKKYIERGILVIERNGIKYNAQGARME